MDLNQEKNLIERAKNNPEDFGQLFEEYYPRIFNFVLKRIGHTTEAQDVSAEAFYKAFRKFSGFNWRGISFGAWLYRIAINEVANLSRRKTFLSLDVLRQESGFDISDTKDLKAEMEEVETAIQKNKELTKLRESIEKLEPIYADVISLFYLAEKPIAEICLITGRKEGTVKAQLSRGREKLRNLMQPEDYSGVIYTDL